MFYVEGLGGRIYRANMDGKSLSLIVQRTDHILGVALDYENSRLYWNDQRSQLLTSCDMDGNIEFFENSFTAEAKLSFSVVGIHGDKLYSTKTSSEGSLSGRGEDLRGGPFRTRLKVRS